MGSRHRATPDKISTREASRSPWERQPASPDHVRRWPRELCTVGSRHTLPGVQHPPAVNSSVRASSVLERAMCHAVDSGGQHTSAEIQVVMQSSAVALFGPGAAIFTQCHDCSMPSFYPFSHNVIFLLLSFKWVDYCITIYSKCSCVFVLNPRPTWRRCRGVAS